tara:strand:+ start:572 stop:751 length:180 start_codon:yes stop_codon:yes gene_type:complete
MGVYEFKNMKVGITFSTFDLFHAGRTYCEEKGIEIYYNARDHRFSSSRLRKQVKLAEDK